MKNYVYVRSAYTNRVYCIREEDGNALQFGGWEYATKEEYDEQCAEDEVMGI